MVSIRNRIERNDLLRLRLRSMQVATDKFPERIRASTIASYFYCGWKSYATAMLGMKMPEKEWMQLGTVLHDQLFDMLGKRFPWEETFIEAVDKYRKDDLGFVRRVGSTDVFADVTGHPDDFEVLPGGMVSIIEYKTTRMPLYLAKRFIVPVAEFQSQIYAYILEPTLESLGYSMSDKHAVLIYSSQSLAESFAMPNPKVPPPIFHRIVNYSREFTEQKILEVFGYYRDPSKIQRCASWKCKYCSKPFKDMCPLGKLPAPLS